MIINHRSFGFSKPNFITKEEYLKLKKDLKSNPDLKLYDNVSFWNYFGKEIKTGILIPLVIAIGIGLLHILLETTLNFEYLGWISGIILFYLLGRLVLVNLWEWGSFLKSNFDKKAYASKLKRKILKSTDYDDLRNSNKFWMRMHPNT